MSLVCTINVWSVVPCLLLFFHSPCYLFLHSPFYLFLRSPFPFPFTFPSISTRSQPSSSSLLQCSGCRVRALGTAGSRSCGHREDSHCHCSSLEHHTKCRQHRCTCEGAGERSECIMVLWTNKHPYLYIRQCHVMLQ